VIGPTNRNNWLTFGADLVPDTDSKSLSTLLNTEEYRILGDLVAFFIHRHRPIFTTPGEMTDADNVMNPQHFDSDLADIRIRIRINSEMWIRIPGSLSRVSTLTRDVDIANLSVSVCLSVRDFPELDDNGLTNYHSFFSPYSSQIILVLSASNNFTKFRRGYPLRGR